MNPDEIKPGRTYEGAEPDYWGPREVVRLTENGSQVFWINEVSEATTPIEEFAAWAVREVRDEP